MAVKREKAAPAADARQLKLPTFRNPPVAEVVAGVIFDASIAGFQIPHVGLFWERVKRDFPTTQHFMPLIPPGGDPRWVDSALGVPLPRIWFVSKSKHNIIQLQGDCFFYNWRKLADEDVYPRHPAVVEGLERYMNEFLKFLKAEGMAEPTPSSCELTYTNYIVHGDGWTSMADVSSIFTDFCWKGGKARVLPDPKAMTWSATFPLPEDNGTLTAQLLQVVKRKDSKPALRLDLTARGLGKAKSLAELRPWFEIARERIVTGFADLTTQEAQHKLWGLEDV
jgi:uncharacterized protein (TIGR04255 family)